MTTPIILALTRRATLCGLPYNAFIGLLIGAAVSFIWIDNMTLVGCLLLCTYSYFRYLCSRDSFALEIFLMHLSQIGPGKHCYYPE